MNKKGTFEVDNDFIYVENSPNRFDSSDEDEIAKETKESNKSLCRSGSAYDDSPSNDNKTSFKTSSTKTTSLSPEKLNIRV